MEAVLFGVAVAVAAQVMFYFIQKALDKLWEFFFPPSNGDKTS